MLLRTAYLLGQGYWEIMATLVNFSCTIARQNLDLENGPDVCLRGHFAMFSFPCKPSQLTALLRSTDVKISDLRAWGHQSVTRHIGPKGNPCVTQRTCQTCSRRSFVPFCGLSKRANVSIKPISGACMSVTLTRLREPPLASPVQ